jgi:hypothetical protein
MSILDVFAVFLARMAGGYAVCLGIVGPRVTEGSWRRISLFVIAGLAIVAWAAGAPALPALGTAVAALILERAVAFDVKGLRSPLWMLPFGVWLVAQTEWGHGGVDSAASAVVAGGTLGTMLLGHSYLTARGLSFTPLKRMAWILFLVLIARAALVAPVFLQERLELWDWVLLSMRGTIGLLLPILFGWMVIQCAKIESNQSATGILYAMTVSVFIGEMISVYLKLDRGLAA